MYNSASNDAPSWLIFTPRPHLPLFSDGWLGIHSLVMNAGALQTKLNGGMAPNTTDLGRGKQNNREKKNWPV